MRQTHEQPPTPATPLTDTIAELQHHITHSHLHTSETLSALQATTAMLADNVVETQRVSAHQHRWTGEALFALEAANAELDATCRDFRDQIRELRDAVEGLKRAGEEERVKGKKLVRDLLGVVWGVVFGVGVVVLLGVGGGRVIGDGGSGGYLDGGLF